MLPTLLLVALYPRPLGLPFPEPLLLSPVAASSPHGGVWELHGVWDWHSFVQTVWNVEIPGSKWPQWPPCSSPPGPMPWLQCLFVLSLYLRLDTCWQDVNCYHRFLLLNTLCSGISGSHRHLQLPSPLPEHVDVKTVEQHSAS